MASYDAIIIGGGPGGSTAATYLARQGRRVLILEKETFPRFHIGESLLPYNMPIFDEMGLRQSLEDGGFMEKFGAQFHLSNGSHVTKFEFGNGRFTNQPKTFQVERSKFDELLLRHAECVGAEVREGCGVSDYSVEPGGVRVTARNGGDPETFEAEFLIDASGTNNFTGNREGLKKIYENHRKIAIFGHYGGIDLPEDRNAGDILIFRLENAWFWFIPLSREKVSLGLVLDTAAFRDSGKSPEEIFDETVKACPSLNDRMQKAKPLGPIRTIADFSYRNRELVSPRLVRVGDAAGFLDPIFSSGVYLAMLSARQAALAVAEATERSETMTSGLRRYEKKMSRYMDSYFLMIEKFYQQPFIDLLFQPRDHFHLPDAILAILAGNLEGGWPVRWRLQYFLWMVRLQSVFPVVKRLDLG